MTRLLARRRALMIPTGLKISDLAALQPYAVAHRAGGADVAPDGTVEALRYGIGRGAVFPDLADVWKSTDAGANLMHDSTVDRTTTATGNSTALSEAAHQALTIDCSSWFSPAWPDTHPPSLESMLATARDAGVACTFEVKTTGDATWIRAICDRVIATGMKDRTMIISAAVTDGPTIAGKGIAFGTTTTGSVSAATLLANNVTFACYDYTDVSVTSGVVAAWIAAGIKVLPFTVNRRSDWTAQLAKGSLAGVYSDDPYYVMGTQPVLTSDTFAAQTFMDGMVPSGAVRGVWRGGVKFGIDGGMAVLMGWGGKAAPWAKIEATLHYEAVPDVTRFAYIAFGCPDDSNFSDHSSFGNGYAATLRPDGRLQLWRRTGASAIGTVTTTGTTLAAGSSVRLRCEFLSPTVVQVTRLDTGLTAQLTDSTYRGGYWHYGNNNNGTGTIQTSMSAVVLTP